MINTIDVPTKVRRLSASVRASAALLASATSGGYMTPASLKGASDAADRLARLAHELRFELNDLRPRE